MAVSKRLRFEILRRDNHTCRYCGRTAPEVKLTVDHVVPEALGGSDDPTNLVAACADCNSGKSSMPATAELVADVAADAERWSGAMQRASTIRAAEINRESELLESFECVWTRRWITLAGENDTSTKYRHPGRWYAPQPDDWKRSILTFIKAGLELDFLQTAAGKSQENMRIGWDNCWRYFCGTCWRELEHRREIAYTILETEEN